MPTGTQEKNKDEISLMNSLNNCPGVTHLDSRAIDTNMVKTDRVV